MPRGTWLEEANYSYLKSQRRNHFGGTLISWVTLLPWSVEDGEDSLVDDPPMVKEEWTSYFETLLNPQC